MKQVLLIVAMLFLTGCYAYVQPAPAVYYPQDRVVIGGPVWIDGHYWYWDRYHHRYHR